MQNGEITPKTTNTNNPQSKYSNYPVIDPNPSFIKVVDNFNYTDYIALAYGGLAGLHSESLRINQGIAQKFSIKRGVIGLIGGFSLAYLLSNCRLKGKFPNSGDVDWYAKQPKYPVIDPHPDFITTVRNFSTRDYILVPWAGSIGAFGSFVYKERQKIKIRMVPPTLAGGLLGFLVAYKLSNGRLKGYYSSKDDNSVQEAPSIQ